MPKQAWIMAAVLTVMLGLSILGVSTWQQGRRLAGAKEELAELRARTEKNQSEALALKSNLNVSLAKIEALQKEKEAVTQAQKSLEDQMRSALQSKDITISELQGKLTVNILDRILFDSGEAVLKNEGEKVLVQIASVLAKYPNRQIHVIGHTDNVPIRASSRSKYPSNWELSAARALAAVRFLSEHAGVDPRRLGAVGYGEYHPVADNSSAEGRAKNRRIALVVLSEELAGSDASPLASPSPTKTPSAQTNTHALSATNSVTLTNAPVSQTNAVPEEPVDLEPNNDEPEPGETMRQ